MGWPGSVSDARVWANSSIASRLQSGVFNIRSAVKSLAGVPVSYYIIGDGGYANRAYCITPIKEDHYLTDAEHHFNFVHSSTRMPAEMGFGHLKGIWRSLISPNCAECSVQERCNYVMTACVLMNIKIAHDGMFLNPDTRNVVFDGCPIDACEGKTNSNQVTAMSDDIEAGKMVRDALVKYCFDNS